MLGCHVFCRVAATIELFVSVWTCYASLQHDNIWRDYVTIYFSDSRVNEMPETNPHLTIVIHYLVLFSCIIFSFIADGYKTITLVYYCQSHMLITELSQIQGDSRSRVLAATVEMTGQVARGSITLLMLSYYYYYLFIKTPTSEENILYCILHT